MAVLFVDSFDHYTTEWTISGVNAAEFGVELEA
jgi:hypothetical protein